MDLTILPLSDTILAILLATISSIASGLFGIGGGIFVVPSLNLFLSIFYPDLTHTMLIASTTSLINVSIVTGMTVYNRRKVLSEYTNKLMWLLPACALGGILGELTTRVLSDDAHHIIFFLFIILSLTSLIVTRNRHFKPLPIHLFTIIVFFIAIICVICGVGLTLLAFPLMIAFGSSKQEAAATCAFNSMISALFASLISFTQPHGQTALPIFYEDIFLPLIVCSLLLSYPFSQIGIFLNNQISQKNIMTALTYILVVIAVLHILSL